jgi:hypothetical protein
LIIYIGIFWFVFLTFLNIILFLLLLALRILFLVIDLTVLSFQSKNVLKFFFHFTKYIPRFLLLLSIFLHLWVEMLVKKFIKWIYIFLLLGGVSLLKLVVKKGIIPNRVLKSVVLLFLLLLLL